MATKNTAKRMSEYRARLRKEGLRPVQIWVPDQRSPGFKNKLRKQVSRLDSKDEANALAFIERVTEEE